MNREFWEERWEQGRIGFHAERPNRPLLDYWASLGVPEGGQVFVPLCGKSLDMLWLSEQGHPVLGAELSELAVAAFFEENEIPVHANAGSYTGEGSGGTRIEIRNGDLFELRSEDLADVRAIYDRAALVALPEEMRARYAEFLTTTAPAGVPILLQTIEYDQAEMAGPPFSVGAAEVQRLFGDVYDCVELERRPVIDELERFRKAGVTALDEIVWRLSDRN